MFEPSVCFVGGISKMVFGSNKFRIRRSQSKASYLAYRRERGAPDSEGSYKRTMSPTSRLEDWSPPRDHDDPVLLRVSPHHPLHHPHHHHNPHIGEISKSHSVDALHHRLEERNQLSADFIGKQDLGKKDPRLRTPAENNNNDNLQDRHQHLQEKRYQEKKDAEQRRERLSPQSVEVLNDRNRQLERERRKLAASCEPLPQSRENARGAGNSPATPSEDFFRERSATIELTSQNIELLNRRNERRANDSPNKPANPSAASSTSTTAAVSSALASSDDTCCPPFSRSPCCAQEAAAKPSPTPEKSNSPRSSTSKSPSDPGVSKKSRKEASAPRRSLSSDSSGSSCSATSSSSISSDAGAPPQVTEARGSPRAFAEASAKPESHFEPRRKVSSPTQTDSAASCSRAGSPGVRETRSERPRNAGKPTKVQPAGGKIEFAGCTSNAAAEGDRADVGEAAASPCVSPQPGIEGLTLVQRTEVVLRVNAATSDAASQTENDMEGAVDGEESVQGAGGKAAELTQGRRRKLAEEIECEELSRDLASQLSPNDKLVTILVPAPEHKKPTDYVSGLFRVEATLQPRAGRRLSLEEPTTPPSCVETDDGEKKRETVPSAPVTPLSSDPASPLSAASAYFTTSEGKARFLARFEGLSRREDPPAVATSDNSGLRQKKEELMMRLDKKLVVLRAEQEAVREEGEVNEALGARVATLISAVARPAEASKYRLHVEEVGKITSLLLGLSGRLARAENALYGMSADHSERKILESKRDKLMDQLEEAKVLKGNIDKRSVNVSAILSKYLKEEEFADYQHFINMKAKLIMDGREIQDKVKLGEEQLAALREAID